MILVAGDIPVAVEEQILRDGLVGCGLKAAGISMVYDADVQGFIITIASAADAAMEHLDCIETAARGEEVVLEDEKLGAALRERGYARAKARWLAETRETLRKRGLLEGLPKRGDFSSDEDFAVALERHCGFAARSILKVRDGEMVFWPDNIREGKQDYERLSALMAAVIYATAETGAFKIGFIGNESVADKP